MTAIRLQILASLIVLMVGYAAVWRRRENVLAYVDGGFLITMLLMPLLATRIIDRVPTEIAQLYANLLLMGAAGYAIGLACGTIPGNLHRWRRPPIFAYPLSRNRYVETIFRRARILGLAGAASLLVGFVAIGYVPLLAADRVSAKYGVGPYASGFQRGVIPYRTGLALASAALPLVLIAYYNRRRFADLLIAGSLAAGLLASLSRTLAFSGIVLVIVCVLVERKVGPTKIVLLVALLFALGQISTEIVFPETANRAVPLWGRIAESPPDMRDHLGFLARYEVLGEQTYGATVLGGLSPRDNYWEPNLYALRTLTGSTNVGAIPSGGLRLPAPIWGYVSFGFIGAGLWSLLAGFFAGWGARRLRNLLTDIRRQPGCSVNLTCAAVYYAGTFGVLSMFYFASSAMIVQIAVALYIASSPLLHGRRNFEQELLAGRRGGRAGSYTR
ncbi:MAG TPA: hypothetical protein VHJ78_01560 [Actinomycetota bacterium]|nr:hypothetical protein [Actinomycetota bacterium]